MAFKEDDLFAGRYRLKKKLGVGGFSEVWLAEDELTGEVQVAIKIYAPNGGLDDSGIKIFSKEYALLSDINNQYLLKAQHFDVVDGSKPYLVMPYCPNGSLMNKLQEKGNMNEADLAKVIYEVSSALQYLHDHGVIHQDIKPDNILVNKNNEYVISDFGISNNIRRTLRKSMGSANTSMSPEYAPPERFSSNPRTVPAGDVFSFGVLIYEMASGDLPWMGMGGMSLSRGAEVPELPGDFSNNLKKMVKASMQLEPEARPTAGEMARAAQSYLEEGFWPKIETEADAAKAAGSVPSGGGRKTKRMDEVQEHIKAVEAASAGQQKSEVSPTEPAGEKADSAPKTLKGNADKAAPKKKKKSAVLLILILVLLVGGGGTGVWFFLENQKKEEFANLVQKAEQEIEDSKLYDATLSLGSALNIFPDDSNATNRLVWLNDSIGIIVNTAIDLSDSLKKQRSFVEAKGVLDSALTYDPENAEVLKRLEELSTLAEKQRDSLFNDFLTKGDNYLDELIYTKAATFYARADSLKPGDPTVKEKLESIGEKLDEFYKAEVAKAKEYIDDRSYKAAIGSCNRALLYKKDGEEAKDLLAKAKEGQKANDDLYDASLKGSSTLISAALAKGADPNYSKANLTVMGAAVLSNCSSCLKMLKDAGASCDRAIDYTIGGHGYGKLITLAAGEGKLESVKFLTEQCGVSLSTTDDHSYYWRTPLMWASANDHYNVAEYLLKSGADAKTNNNGGYAAYDYAKSSSMKALLKSYGGGMFEFEDNFSYQSNPEFEGTVDEYKEWAREGGVYVVRTKKEGYANWYGVKMSDLNLGGDWEISVDVRIDGGNSGYGGIGIMFAAHDDWDYKNFFGYSQNGKYHLGYYDTEWNGNFIETPSLNEGLGEWNTLKVMKEGTRYKYYINGTYITSRSNLNLAGTRFGFYYSSSDGFTRASFDNLKIIGDPE